MQTELENRPAAVAVVRRAWVGLAVLCAVCWGIWGFLSKIGSGLMTPQAMQILFVVGMAPPVALALVRTGFAVGRNRIGVAYGLLNGVLASFGMLAFYAAMARGKASIIGPITALFPLFTVAGAVLFLKERLNRVQVAGIVVALIAVLIFAR